MTFRDGDPVLVLNACFHSCLEERPARVGVDRLVQQDVADLPGECTRRRSTGRHGLEQVAWDLGEEGRPALIGNPCAACVKTAAQRGGQQRPADDERDQHPVHQRLNDDAVLEAVRFAEEVSRERQPPAAPTRRPLASHRLHPDLLGRDADARRPFTDSGFEVHRAGRLSWKRAYEGSEFVNQTGARSAKGVFQRGTPVLRSRSVHCVRLQGRESTRSGILSQPLRVSGQECGRRCPPSCGRTRP